MSARLALESEISAPDLFGNISFLSFFDPRRPDAPLLPLPRPPAPPATMSGRPLAYAMCKDGRMVAYSLSPVPGGGSSIFKLGKRTIGRPPYHGWRLSQNKNLIIPGYKKTGRTCLVILGHIFAPSTSPHHIFGNDLKQMCLKPR